MCGDCREAEKQKGGPLNPTQQGVMDQESTHSLLLGLKEGRGKEKEGSNLLAISQTCGLVGTQGGGTAITSNPILNPFLIHIQELYAQAQKGRLLRQVGIKGRKKRPEKKSKGGRKY